MVLKYIKIQRLGAVDCLEFNFEDSLNVIKSRYPGEIAQAIRLVLGHKISSLSEYRARKDTEVEALVRLDEKEYKVMAKNEFDRKELCLRAYDEDGNDMAREYLYLTSHCMEHDLSDVFFGDGEKTLFKLLQYLDEDRYYFSKELSRRTDRLSETKSFRAYLKAFVKDFQPELIREGKRYELCLEKNGKYTVRYKGDNDMPVSLSESEQTLLRYLCFLKTAEFWQGFEELRNLHGTKKPLVVADFLERLDESIDVSGLLQRSAQLNRQLILLTS